MTDGKEENQERFLALVGGGTTAVMEKFGGEAAMGIMGRGMSLLSSCEVRQCRMGWVAAGELRRSTWT